MVVTNKFLGDINPALLSEPTVFTFGSSVQYVILLASFTNQSLAIIPWVAGLVPV